MKFLFLPDGEDPDSIVRKEGAAGFDQRLAQATPLSEFFYAELSKDVNLAGMEGKARLAERAKPLLAGIPDGAFRDLMQQRVVEAYELELQAPAREGYVAPRFDDLDYLHDIGDIEINISGCMNACGHHHVGHIGILGVDKNGEEWYQVTLGGAQGNRTSLGKVIGPSFARDDMPAVIAQIIETYVELRIEDEHFIDTVRRTGIEPFKTRVYANRETKRKVVNG